MKSIILAAGFCTRLFPITEYFPKALLTVSGKAILSYILDDVVNKKDIDDIVLVTNHRYKDIFSVWLRTRYPNRHIPVIDNGIRTPNNRLGAVGDLAYVLQKLKWQDDVLVLASDTIATISVKKFIQFYYNHNGPINAVFDTEHKETIRKKLGCVNISGDRLVEFVEKPENPATTLTSIPYYIFSKASLGLLPEYMKSDVSKDAPGFFMSWMVNKIPSYAYVVKGMYSDVGTIDAYNALAKQDFISKFFKG
jgi:glucose-1-phosphate thymidylyltransferase